MQNEGMKSKGFKMRFKLLVITVVFAVSGYVFLWHYMADKAEGKMLDFIKQKREQGYEISYDELLTEGFPYRIVIHFPEIDIVIPPSLSENILGFYRVKNLFMAVQPWKLSHGIILADTLWAANIYNASEGFSAKMSDIKSSVIVDEDYQNFLRMSVKINQFSWNYDRGANDEKASFAHNINFHIRSLTEENRLKKAKTSGFNRAAKAMNAPIVELLFKAEKIETAGFLANIYGEKIHRFIFEGQLNGEEIPELTEISLKNWRDGGGTLSLQRFEMQTDEIGLVLKGDIALDDSFKPLGALSLDIKGMDYLFSIFSAQESLKQGEGLKMLEKLKQDAEIQKEQGKSHYSMNISLQNGLLFLGEIPLTALPSFVGQD